ncbi:MAG: hypothetical protein QM785_13475 [Pyrinomonadaceae bacterium]
MLKETVFNALVEEFGDAVESTSDSIAFAEIKAKHPAVGNVSVQDDGTEITLFIGDITHGHFGSYEDDLSEEEHERVIAESLVEFLSDLFEDKYFLYTSRHSGGWARFDMVQESDMQSPNTQWFKWSGPIEKLE